MSGIFRDVYILKRPEQAISDYHIKSKIEDILAKVELDELSEHLGIEFPDEDFQTLNGFMLYELGRLPYENEKIDITYKGYNFETIGIKDKMIDKVRITKVENENQV